MAIHHTMGVYANGDRVNNGVMTEHLDDHITYNRAMRPGRALFVDGRCVHRGYIPQETCDAIERDLAANPKTMTRCTAPYR